MLRWNAPFDEMKSKTTEISNMEIICYSWYCW